MVWILHKLNVSRDAQVNALLLELNASFLEQAAETGYFLNCQGHEVLPGEIVHSLSCVSV
jgi:hypothetical protein